MLDFGYINNLELTKKSFVENPYKEKDIIYKSGDIGYYKDNGEIVCLGRIDNQVKVRGLRIELEEIESRILEYPNILHCVVDKRTEGTREFLCAYYTKIGDIDISELKKYILKYLPAYMVPQYFIELQELPYTPNGKIDRKKLLLINIDKSTTKKEDIDILTEDELKFVNIWKRLLKLDYISIDDDFFEIGGDSILAITLQIAAMKLGFNIKYEDIFKYKTIRKMLNKDEDTYEFDISDYDYSDINKLISLNTKENIPKDIKKQELGNVLLTGGTGFLGSHIIDNFLQEEKGTIYCLIRGENKESCEKRLESILKFYFENKYINEIGNRIQVVNGDITSKDLNIDERLLTQITEEITTVIHSASLVKHYGDENKFFNSNINGTKNIIDFCINHDKKLVYVSTIGVSGTTSNNDLIFSEKDLYIEQKIKNIYLYSKYMAERLVLEGLAKGLNAIIVRPGNILNTYTDYKFQKNFEENRFIGVLKSFIDIKKIPMDFKNRDIEISPVDYMSSAIIKLLQYPSNCNIFNLVNTKTLKFDTLISILKELNIDIEFVETKEFEELISTIINDEEKSSVLSGLIDNLGNTVDFEFKNNTAIAAEFTEQYLKNIGFEWPLLDKVYMKNIIKYFYDIKYFNY